MNAVSVYPEHELLRRHLVERAQSRPDLLPVTRTMVALAQEKAESMGIDPQVATTYMLLHELGKYVTSRVVEPLRIAACDLPRNVMISQALEAMPELAKGVKAPSANMVALIAWCELRVMPGGKVITLHQRQLYMERHYSSDHDQFACWRALAPLAQRVEEM
jgi:hypothetical protein